MTHTRNENADAFIHYCFRPEDRVAVVVIHKPSDSVVQRLVTARRITEPEFQEWLQQRNDAGCEVYVSMNTLGAKARGRTKEDVAAIRHIYLDFDHDGTRAVAAMLARRDLPAPAYRLNTSKDKWQVIWNVEGFSLEDAERLQRGLARQTGADIAATDAARVLRVPGFHNHKYAEPYFVTGERLHVGTHTPDAFPAFPAETYSLHDSRDDLSRTPPEGRHESQSERDWAFAKRALARGEPKDLVIAAIASYRRFDKPDPDYYATLTVTKAARSLEAAVGRTQTNDLDR